VAQTPSRFEKLSAIDRFANGAIGVLVGLGVGPAHMRVLEVVGRKSGRRYTLPVDLLDHGGKRYLVAPRGYTQWVRNAEAQGEVTLRRGSQRARYGLRALADAEKPPVLKAYLDGFRSEVQRFFSVKAGAPVGEFVPLVAQYPRSSCSRATA
jgi:deazaflavin-dependent oxidoreductase (nitroreductase family)